MPSPAQRRTASARTTGSDRLTTARTRGNAEAVTEKKQTQEMWGGRFGGGPAELMQRINASIGFDKRLWREDIAASKAHAAMLRDQGIIGAADAQAILNGLEAIAAEFQRDGVPENVQLEDIHMTVRRRGGCTPHGHATIRWRWTSGCGCGQLVTKPRRQSTSSSARSSLAPRSMPTA